MALDYQKLIVPFHKGVDTKSDRKTIPADKLSALENGVFTENGTIKKRRGYTILSNRILNEDILKLTGSDGLATKNLELINFSNDKLYSYLPSRDRWIDKGTLLSVAVSSSIVVNSLSNQTNADYAASELIYVHAWEDSRGGIRFTVGDINSKTTYVDDQLLDQNGTSPQCISFDGNLQVLYLDTTNTKLKSRLILPGNPVDSSLAASRLVVADATGSFDVNVSGSSVVYAYQTSGGRIAVGALTSTGAHSGTLTSFSATVGGAGPIINQWPNGDSAVIWHETGVGSFMKVYRPEFSGSSYDSTDMQFNISAGSPLILVTTVPTNWPATGSVLVGGESGELMPYGTLSAGTITLTVPSVTQQSWTAGSTVEFGDKYSRRQRIDEDTNEFFRMTAVISDTPISEDYYKTDVFGDVTGSAGKYVHHTSQTGLELSGSSVFLRHYGLGTRAFKNDGKVFVGLTHDSNLQSGYFFVDTERYIIAKALPGIGGGSLAGNSLPSVTSKLNNKHSVDIIFRNNLDLAAIVGLTGSTGTTFFGESGIRKYDLDFSSRDSFDHEVIGDTLYTAGGSVQIYDGHKVQENSFSIYPEDVEFTVSNTALDGIDVDSGDYSYLFHWEHVLKNGEREMSTAIPYNLNIPTVVTESYSVTATFNTLSLTNKDDVRLAVYRTKSGANTYYRVDDPLNPVYNVSGSDVITFTDTLNDSVIGLREYAYMNAQLGNDAPPAAKIIKKGKQRLFLSGLAEDEMAVRYSKLAQNSEVVPFSDAFEVRLDDEGGPITALEIMDENVIIFKKHKVFVMVGNGPNDLGQANDFSVPQQVTSDVGCTQLRSVVLTPMGVMFMSSKGFYLIDRSFQFNYIGADVELYNNSTITSAEVVPDRNEVRFLTSDGTTLLYDYFFNSWSIHPRVTGEGGTIWDNKYVWVGTDGITHKESEEYVDGTTAYSLVMETAWINFGSLQNFGRVRKALLIGDFKTHHNLKISIAYNYEESYVNSVVFGTTGSLATDTWGSDDTWGSGSFWGGQSDNQYQLMFNIPNPRCQAIKFKFEDRGSTGESYEIQELMLEVGMLPGSMRVGSNKRL